MVAGSNSVRGLAVFRKLLSNYHILEMNSLQQLMVLFDYPLLLQVLFTKKNHCNRAKINVNILKVRSRKLKK